MLLTIAIVSLSISIGAEAADISFNRDVRPILSDRCFKCHGPDAANQESEFRIDSFENATADLGGYFGVVPGDLEKSTVHLRIHDEDDPMPPADSIKPLTDKEKAVLDEWIRSGAKFESHWAFTPLPEVTAVPDVAELGDLTDWTKGPIDRFIAKRLTEQMLKPAADLPRNKWLRRITFDLTGLPPTEKELQDFATDESPDAEGKVVDRLKKSCNVLVDHGGEFVIGQRFRARGFTGGLIDDVRLYTRQLTAVELQSFASEKTGEPTPEYFASAIDEPTRAALEALTAARKEFVMAEEVMNEIPIMVETKQPRPAYVLARGQYDAPQTDETRVDRSTPSALKLSFPKDAPLDRKGLAQWVTDPQHPLTARVAVNRFWGNFFADPLVRTSENFGLQGELPTHPQLLDWLSRDFIDNGWDVKRFCRNVVLSATYRQDSKATQEQLASDPTNRLLARGPAYRLGAEQIRDLMLAASGLLNSEMGGPPVSPYQPGEDLWKESNSMSPTYKQSVGISLYRRSLYSVWKRTEPLPNMLAFDSTSREVCTVKRSRTNTPLQALVLLNDVQFVEAARFMAQQLMSIKDDDARIHEAFIRLAGRRCDDRELEVLQKLFADERTYFNEHREDAQHFVSIGDLETNSEVDVASLAAMTTICQAILNLDATIWKR